MTLRTLKRLKIIGLSMVVLLGIVVSQFPRIGAALILHPPRRPMMGSGLPEGCRKVTFQGDGVSLQGWRGDALGDRRGTLIYLHGVADNRASGAGVLSRFRKRGFDVIAYDSRAQGESGGDACTYGFREKVDLRRVMETARGGPIVLVGGSLGAAVALQLSASDKRITAVVAAESFSDLRTVAVERAPFFLTSGMIEKAFKIAEQKGGFHIDSISPESAARMIKIPVLVIHGAEDSDTPPDHARRIFSALAGPKRLILVPGAKHNEALSGNVWGDIENWIDESLENSTGER